MNFSSWRFTDPDEWTEIDVMNIVYYAASEMPSSPSSYVISHDSAQPTWVCADGNSCYDVMVTETSVSKCPIAGRSTAQSTMDRIMRLRGERFQGVDGVKLRRMTRQEFVERDADYGSMLYDRVQLLLADRFNESVVTHGTAETVDTIAPPPREAGQQGVSNHLYLNFHCTRT